MLGSVVDEVGTSCGWSGGNCLSADARVYRLWTVLLLVFIATL